MIDHLAHSRALTSHVSISVAPEWKRQPSIRLPDVGGIEPHDHGRILADYALPHGGHVQVHIDICETRRRCQHDLIVAERDDEIDDQAYDYYDRDKSLFEFASTTALICCKEGRCAGHDDDVVAEMEHEHICPELRLDGVQTEDRAQAFARRSTGTIVRATTLRFRTKREGVALVGVIFVAPNAKSYTDNVAAVDSFVERIRWRR